MYALGDVVVHGILYVLIFVCIHVCIYSTVLFLIACIIDLCWLCIIVSCELALSEFLDFLKQITLYQQGNWIREFVDWIAVYL